MLPHHFQQPANSAITLVNHQAAIFAAIDLHRSKQAARIAAAPFQRGASSAITLLHPSIKQPVLLPHSFQQAAIFASTPLLPRASFAVPVLHPLVQAAISVITHLQPSNTLLFLLPHVCIVSK
jgi:hypothetical protein